MVSKETLYNKVFNNKEKDIRKDSLGQTGYRYNIIIKPQDKNI